VVEIEKLLDFRAGNHRPEPHEPVVEGRLGERVKQLAHPRFVGGRARPETDLTRAASMTGGAAKSNFLSV
jgi:hypothetical protein